MVPTSAHDGKCALVQTDGMNRYVYRKGEDARFSVWKYSDMKLGRDGFRRTVTEQAIYKTAELFAAALRWNYSIVRYWNQETSADVSLEQRKATKTAAMKKITE